MIYLTDARDAHLEAVDALLALPADDLLVGLISTNETSRGLAVEITDRSRDNVFVSTHAGLIDVVLEAVAKITARREIELERRDIHLTLDVISDLATR